jgi:branched-chain amino acid transport system ATP-binding protein
LLRVENLNVHYGGIHALRGISLNVEEGKIISLIGANGAGKSTTLRAVMGLEKPSDGKIIYQDQDITGKATKEIVKSNLVLVPEGRRVFTNLTVKENLVLGAYLRKNQESIDEDMKWVFDLFPILKNRQQQKAGTMSGGEQQMLAVGRALMTKPKLLMMDEPSLGLAPLIVKNIFEIIKKINQEGVTILLIEQNAKASLEISDYAYVLETGQVFMQGKGLELLNNEEVKKAYLGT